ncbi:MAG: hypothetical protein ROR55_21135 [Devosia sp.]
MREPFVTLSSGGSSLMGTWGPLILEVRIVDERGTEGDKLTVVLDDRDGQISYPPTGSIITVTGGYRDTGALVVGQFVVDGIDLEGWPQKVTIHGSSVDAKSAAKERKTETHKEQDVPTLGDLINKIAGRNGWSAAIADELKSIPIKEAEHQTEQSDVGFLDDLVQRHDGTLSVKQGRLVALMKAGLTSASGSSLAPIVISPGVNLLKYQVRWSDKPVHGKVEARYFDRLLVETIKVEESVGDGGEDVVSRIREAFPSKEEAQRAAKARARELTRGDGTATFEIEGDPSVGAEIPVVARGIRSGVDGTWAPVRVEHVWNDNGYTNRIETETPGSGDSRGDG